MIKTEPFPSSFPRNNEVGRLHDAVWNRFGYADTWPEMPHYCGFLATTNSRYKIFDREIISFFRLRRQDID